jgi:hypothetical protein
MNLAANLTAIDRLADLSCCCDHATATLEELADAPTDLTPIRRNIDTLAANLRRAITDIEQQVLA